MSGIPESSRRPERRARRPHPRRWLRRIAIAWLVSAAAATTAGAAGGLLALTDHACCAKSAARASAPPAPCQALLPLACCDGTTLPAVAPAAPDRSDSAVALLPAPAAQAHAPRPAVVFSQHTVASSPRSSPLALSVVLRI